MNMVTASREQKAGWLQVWNWLARGEEKSVYFFFLRMLTSLLMARLRYTLEG
jgi:hypothetical protein